MSTSSRTTEPANIDEALNRIHDLSSYTAITKNKTLLTRWVFTWNNYTESDVNKLKTFGQKLCKYLIFGFEEAPTTGTKHLQGYIHLLKRMSFNQLKTILGPTPSLYMAKKNDLANYRYCSKSDKFYFYESSLFGTQTESSTNQTHAKKLTTKERMELAYELAKQERFDEIDKDLLIKHGKVLKSLRIEDLQVEDNLFYDQGENNYFHCHNLWIWGETGTGKSFFINYFIKGINHWWSRYCNDHNIQYFELRAFNHQKTKWWCGYMGEEIVIINEVNPTFCSWYANEIKEWVDQYPFNAEVKGSNIGKIRPLFFIFTSNYNLDECFCEMRGRDVVKDEITGKPKLLTEDIKAMHRRMKVIKRNKEDRNKLVRWPCIKMLNKYHDTFDKVKEEMNKIQTDFNNIIDKAYDEYKNIIINKNDNVIEKATSSNSSTPKKQQSPKKIKTPIKKDKGKKPANSQSQNENKTSDIFETPKQRSKRQLEIPDKPRKQDIGTCEICQRPKIYSKVSDGWMCNGCYHYSSDCTCIPLTKPRPLDKKNEDDIQEINDSFIATYNGDKFVTSTQINSKSIIEDEIEEIPSSPLKEISLERQNAFLYDKRNNEWVGEPPTSLDIPSELSIPKTPSLPGTPKSDYSFNDIELNDINNHLQKIEDNINHLEENINKSVNDLSDDQETYIPQVDGAADELIDEYDNVFKSTKQKYFIHKQFQLVFKINEYIKKIKYAYDKKRINEVTFIRQLKQYETKKQHLINQYELFKYKFPDNSQYKNIDICHYCKSGVLNHCSCTGEYINNIPAESFEEKLLWLENRKYIQLLENLNRDIRINFKQVEELDDCCFNIWKYKYKFDSLREQKIELLTNHPFIKKFDSLGNHYTEKLCWYCNYGVRKLCECSGKCIYTDREGNKFLEDDTLDSDRDFDQWQEQDRH